MKIVLDLEHSINNYDWQDKEELKRYIELMKYDLNELYYILEEKEDIEDTYIIRLYDMFDMFSKYEIIGDDE